MPKNFLLIEHGGDSKTFTFNALAKHDTTLYVAASTVPDWLLAIIPRERIIETDTYNSVSLLASVVAFSEAHNIRFDAIGTFFEHVVVQTADIADTLGVVGIQPKAARRSSANKLLMRRTLRDAGVPMPRFTVINILNASTLNDAITKVGLPSVLKPIFGSQSYGTIKIENDYEAQVVIDEALSHTGETSKEVFKNFPGIFLLEEYLSGPVVSIDGIIQDGNVRIAGMVEFIMGPEPRFMQEANYIPARFDIETTNAAKAMAERIVEALGFNNCGFHCELRLTPIGPRLIEIAARLPGGPIQPGYKAAYGIDLTDSLIKVLLGEAVSIEHSREHAVIQKAFFAHEHGRIATLDTAKAAALPGVIEFVQIAYAGEDIVTYPNIPKPLYYYFAEAGSAEALAVLSKQIEDMVELVIDK